MFAAASGNLINPDNLRRDHDRLVKRAGVPRIRIHDQRHTRVTLALQAGAPIGAVSKRVGHSRTSVAHAALAVRVVPGAHGQAQPRKGVSAPLRGQNSLFYFYHEAGPAQCTARQW